MILIEFESYYRGVPAIEFIDYAPTQYSLRRIQIIQLKMKIKNIADGFIQTFLRVHKIETKRITTKLINKQAWISDIRYLFTFKITAKFFSFFIEFLSLIKEITREHQKFTDSKKSIDDYFGITTVKVNLTAKKKQLKIKNPGEILTRPIFLVTDHNGYYISNWNIRDLCSTKPIKMSIKLICEMYDATVMNLDYENPPGTDDSLTV